MTAPVLLLLVAAGAALVVQNLLMARISGTLSSGLMALVLNSAVGLVLLCALLMLRSGTAGLREIASAFRPWFLLPGVLGSLFVFASVTGYRSLGAAPTIATLVTSQLVLGLVWDMTRGAAPSGQALLLQGVGAALLIAGAVILVSRGLSS